MKKILLTGSNGLVGQNILKKLIAADQYNLLATSYSSNKYPDLQGYQFRSVDITDRKSILNLEHQFRPSVIIHCGAMTQVDPCEENQALAEQVNLEGTRNLADLASACQSHFIYLSTDFVFSGEDGPYTEEDQPAPANFYGQTKLEAENYTRCLEIPWTIVRTILVYGVTPSMSRSNLVLWVKSSLESNKVIHVVDDQFRMPTLVNDLADGILSIVERNATGVYHLSGPDMHSIFELAKMTAHFFNLDENLIRPISSAELNQPGKRPPSTGFDLRKARENLGYQPKKFEEGLSLVQNLLVNLGKT